MPKSAWSGSGAIVETVHVSFAVGQIRRVPRPNHPYGSPAADLKKEEAEARRQQEAEEAAARQAEEAAVAKAPTPEE